jgi:leader peptidase (prepilin peptidase)/N-methyltransferase
MTLIELISTSQLALVAAGALLGLLVGSFLNVVAYRLPVMMQRSWKTECYSILELEPSQSDAAQLDQTFNLSKPDSHCPICDHKIKAWENIPVISYLILGGKCSGCSAHISIRYPTVEILSGLCSALVVFTFGPNWLSLALLVLSWSLIVLTLIDLDHQLLPDNITLPMLWLGLLVNTIGLGMGVSLPDAVIGAMAGYLVLWCFYWVFKLLTGKDGMGYGDFKLLAALGAWMGWQSLLPVIIISSLVGAITGIITITILKHDRSAPMPFGPFLAGAGFIVLIWGPQLTAFYFNSFVN